jgi:tetratricopeptide (TPR) repeat protein
MNSYYIMSGASRGVGMLLYFQGYPEEGRTFIEKSLELAQDTGDTSLQALCYVNKGMICFKNEPAKAFEHFTRALKLAKAVSDKAIQAGCYTNLGAVSRATKQPMKAERYINKALRIATSTGDQTVEPLCYSVLGDISRDRGYTSVLMQNFIQAGMDFILAANRYYQALMLAEAVDNATVIITSCFGLCQAYSLLGAYQLGVEYGQQAAKYAERFGNKELEASCYAMMGLALDQLGKSEEAANSFSKQKECLAQASKSHPFLQQIDQIKALIPTKTQE